MTIELKMNDKPRRTLAQQLDRLDTILDGLADGLNEAVAQAVGNAVRQAVETALLGFMKNPEILAKLRPAAPVPTAPINSTSTKLKTQPSWLRWAWNAVRDTVVAVVARLGGAVSCCASAVWSLPGRAVSAAKIVALLAWENRVVVVIAVGAGATVGIGCYLAGPGIAATAGALAAVAIAFVGHLLAPVATFVFGGGRGFVLGGMESCE